MSHQKRSASLLGSIVLGVLLGAAAVAPAVAGVPRTQSLVPDSLPQLARGQEGVISFTATKSLTTVVRQVSFYVPDGVHIVGIGPGRTGNMPQCQVANALPSNYVTCVAKLNGDAYFAFAPMHSIGLRVAVDAAANLDTLTGKARIEQRYDGIHDTDFGVAVRANPLFEEDALHRSKRQLGQIIAAAGALLSAASTALLGWHVHSLPLQALPVALPAPSSAYPTYVPGRPGLKGGRYSAVGKIAAYDAVPNANGGSTLYVGHCSGVVVPSKGRNVVMTAAHCLLRVDPVTKQVTWRSRLAFCPGLRGSDRTTQVTVDNPISCPPEAVYTAAHDPTTGLPRAHLNSIWADVLTNQVGAADPRVAQYDLAFVELEPNAVTGKPVEEVHGSNAIGFNLGAFADFTLAKNVGYNGDSWDLNICNKGALVPTVGMVALTANATTAMTLMRRDVRACNQRQGVSGGPWIARDDPDSNPRQPTGIVFGVNAMGIVPDMVMNNPVDLWSTTAVGEVETQYTPIFRDWALGLYKSMSGIDPIPFGWGMR